jgi:hypothetical protein
MEQQTLVLQQQQRSQGTRVTSKILRWVLICLFILAAILVFAVYNRATAPSLAEAEQAAVEFLDLPLAIELYEQIADRGSSWERTQAEMALALIEWHIYENPQAARDRLSQLIERDRDAAEPFIALARMEIAQQDFVAARQAARGAMEVAQTGAQLRDAQRHFAWAVVEEATLSRLSPDSLTFPSDELLGEAHAMLREIVANMPGELQSSRLLLATSLLVDDGNRALLAWRSYYWVSEEQEPFPLLVDAYATLQEILPRWQGPASPAGDRERLINALADSRFFDAAALVALEPRAEMELSVGATDTVAYARFLRRLQARMDTYYRGEVTGSDKTIPWRVFDQEIETLCEAICTEGENGTRLKWRLQDRFGATWHFLRGHRDLFMGHVVVDEELTVEQYGHQATINDIRLDGLVSHGLRSWMLDKYYLVGGWANKQQIISYRPFRVNLLLILAEAYLDQEVRQAYEAGVAANARSDDRLAAKDPYAYLSSLNHRLMLRSLDAIWADTGASGLTGAEQRMRFLAELDAVWTEGPANAHEGRHVIDFRAGITTLPEVEVNAKLAETAFCRYPGIPLGANILYPNMGAAGHGEANLLIVQGLVDWMEAHADEIEGLDPSRPFLPQLDLLSDEQLRAIARSMDPLAQDD